MAAAGKCKYVKYFLLFLTSFSVLTPILVNGVVSYTYASKRLHLKIITQQRVEGLQPETPQTYTTAKQQQKALEKQTIKNVSQQYMNQLIYEVGSGPRYLSHIHQRVLFHK